MLVKVGEIYFYVMGLLQTDLSSVSLRGVFPNFGRVLLQHVALLVPAGPAEGDTFPDPHNAPGQ